MAEYCTRTVVTTRREYTLPAPAMLGELRKMIASVEADLGEERAAWDDCARVRVTDDEIVISYELSQDALSPVAETRK